MRFPAAAFALAALASILGAAWISGCNDLTSDCELNLRCAPASPPDEPKCSGLFMPGACDVCLQGACCQELADCALDGVCLNGCLFNVLPSPPECASPPTAGVLQALDECLKSECPAECAPADQCNPVTVNGCPAGGTDCDLVYPGIFVCLPPFGTPAAICEACNNLNGPYCGGGLHCFAESNTCARYCCSDADCGVGRCELDPLKAFGAPLAVAGDAVGLCVNMAAGMGPACDAPQVSPSGGACFAGFAPM